MTIQLGSEFSDKGRAQLHSVDELMRRHIAVVNNAHKENKEMKQITLETEQEALKLLIDIEAYLGGLDQDSIAQEDSSNLRKVAHEIHLAFHEGEEFEKMIKPKQEELPKVGAKVLVL